MTRIKLPFKVKRPILALGADMKGAFALAKGDTAFLFDGFGDLSDADNFKKYEDAVIKAKRALGIKPAIIACDLHPNYFSAHLEENCQLKVQHHEAHIASLIVDKSIKGKVIGVAFDGTGYGSDSNMWGGEFFIGSLRKFNRVAHFDYVSMPGGDAVVKEPWRMAVSYLYQSLGNRFSALKIPFVKRLDKDKTAVLLKMIHRKINAPLTSSAGRLFDAAGSIISGKLKADKEAELPIWLERIAFESVKDSYNFGTTKIKGVYIVKMGSAINGIARDISKKTEEGVISAKFHNTIAKIITDICAKIRKMTAINKVALTGGVFQNRYLSLKAEEALRNKGFSVFTHSAVETNDSGIPIGQIAIASARS